MTVVADPRRGEGRVLQGGRLKAFRPLPEADRMAALNAALDAYERGDHFLAHELLEPAWMGTADPAERDLYQGLIKLAAGFVHAARGNPAGMANNLRGASERLRRVPEREARRLGIALRTLMTDLDEAIETAERLTERPTGDARDDSTGEPGAARRRPLDVVPPRVRGADA